MIENYIFFLSVLAVVHTVASLGENCCIHLSVRARRVCVEWKRYSCSADKKHIYIYKKLYNIYAYVHIIMYVWHVNKYNWRRAAQNVVDASLTFLPVRPTCKRSSAYQLKINASSPFFPKYEQTQHSLQIHRQLFALSLADDINNVTASLSSSPLRRAAGWLRNYAGGRQISASVDYYLQRGVW